MEIIVVVAIIVILGTIVIASVRIARDRASVARTQSDLRELRNAVDRLGIDTGLQPTVGASKDSDTTCVQVGASNNELELDNAAAGIGSTDGNFPGWRGPYMTTVPTDPWGNQYIFDGDYDCQINSVGCEAYTDGQTVKAIHSPGPNSSAINTYDDDNIVLVLCA